MMINNQSIKFDFNRPDKSSGIYDNYKLSKLDNIIRNEKDEVKYYGIEQIRKQMEPMNRIRKALFSAFMGGGDPIKAGLKVYDEYIKEIKNGDLSEEDKQKHIIGMGDTFDSQVKIFARHVKAQIFFAGLMRDPRNPRSVVNRGIDGQTLKNIEQDILKMFKNAKDFYDNGGSLDDITGTIIEKNTNGMKYKDLLSLNEMLKQIKEEQNNLDEKIQYEIKYGDGFTESEMKSYIHYIRDTSNRFEISDFFRGVYFDMIV